MVKTDDSNLLTLKNEKVKEHAQKKKINTMEKHFRCTDRGSKKKIYVSLHFNVEITKKKWKCGNLDS